MEGGASRGSKGRGERSNNLVEFGTWEIGIQGKETLRQTVVEETTGQEGDRSDGVEKKMILYAENED